MPACLLGVCRIRKRTAGLGEYMQKVAARSASMGGEYLVHGKPAGVLAGGLFDAHVVELSRFQAREQALALNRSPGYGALMLPRAGAGAGDCQIAVFDGAG